MSSIRFGRFSDGTPVGDVIPAWFGGAFHLYVLAPPPDTIHYPQRMATPWRHISTSNLVDWAEHGTAISPGPADSYDGYAVWTGSVVADGRELTAYYTGVSADGVQSVCAAISDDGIRWTKATSNPVLCAPAGFDPAHWRDPFVQENAGPGSMLITARQHDQGVIARASRDSTGSWKVDGVEDAPYGVHTPECPEQFTLDGREFLAYSRYNFTPGTVYRRRVDDAWLGMSPDRSDGEFFYAAKGASDDRGRRVVFGWIPDRDPAPTNPAHPWLWGGDLGTPREAYVHPADHSIAFRLPAELQAQLGPSIECSTSQRRDFGRVTRRYDAGSEINHSRVDLTVRDVRQTRLVALVLQADDATAGGVSLIADAHSGHVSLVDASGWTAKRTTEFAGLWDTYPALVTRPWTPAELLTVTAIVRGDLVEVFIDDVVALSFRTSRRSMRSVVLTTAGGHATPTLTWTELAESM